ncbi:synaptopodin [Petromyzon marinus]|uniref:synaptopodin n=1 Tax=Petromyzon marinus TaxID=7757 RepID=UPI003F71AC1C
MSALPDACGRGAELFARRRQRLDAHEAAQEQQQQQEQLERRQLPPEQQGQLLDHAPLPPPPSNRGAARPFAPPPAAAAAAQWQEAPRAGAWPGGPAHGGAWPTAEATPTARTDTAGGHRTGILDEMATKQRLGASTRPMFTFREKCRVGPNPDLVALVHGLDAAPQGPAQGQAEAQGEAQAEGVTRPRKEAPVPPPKPRVGLPAPCEVPHSVGLVASEGKGAALFARRQTRMERFTMQGTGGASSNDSAEATPPEPPLDENV